MGFLFPLFLFATIALAIPVLIHLFNLRRYKKMDFPTLRFLRQFMVQNKKMSKIQRKLLLAARLLTLAFLVLAFAQPYWNKGNIKTGKDAAWVIYIDNSLSMSLKAGQQSLLDIAKMQASEWVRSQDIQQFYVISNDALQQVQPLSKQEALLAISKIQYSSLTVNAVLLANTAQGIREQLFRKNIHMIAFSDFQEQNWSAPKTLTTEGVYFILYPVQLPQKEVANVYIDTAFFLEAPVDPMEAVPMITVIRKSGNAAISTRLQTMVNAQNRRTQAIEMGAGDTLISDTTDILLSAGKWNQIAQSLQSREAVFDDSFFVTARINPAMDILILNESGSNAYLTNAFSAQYGIHPLQQPLSQDITADNKYSLVALQGITQLSERQGDSIVALLKNGRSVALFLGRNARIQQLNAGLSRIGPIQVLSVDTSLQQIVDLQSSHPLLKDVLEQVPDNVQLPFSQYSYKIKAGITAAGQDVMRFRDGSPFISQYNIHSGKLYLFANPLTPESGNLATSYYFAPIVHKMAANSSSGNTYAVEIADNQQIWIANTVQDDKQVFKLYKDQVEIIPRQQSKGMGVTVFIPGSLAESGFYELKNGNKNAEYLLGVNFPRDESEIIPAAGQELLRTFGKSNSQIINNEQQLRNLAQSRNSFPLWKVAVILSLLMLAIETYILLGIRSADKKAATS